MKGRIQTAARNRKVNAIRRHGWASLPDRMPFDFHDVLGAIAPRAIYVSAPTREGNFDVTGVRDVIASVTPVYRLFHAGNLLTAVYPDCEHDWPTADRIDAYEWVDRQLRPARNR